jgi:hypothetical protein
VSEVKSGSNAVSAWPTSTTSKLGDVIEVFTMERVAVTA